MDLAGGSIFSGGNIQLYENNNSDAQRWVFEKFMTDRDVCDTYAKENKNLMEDGTYYIKNKDIKYSIDISNGSLYSGANVQLNLLKRTNMQKWIITHDSMGYVSFKNMGTGMYLTANGNTKESNIIQQTNSNDYNQKWIIMFDKNQNIKIVSALNSKLVVDVLYGNIKDGSNIQLYDSNNTNAQKWVFEYVNTNSTSDLCKLWVQVKLQLLKWFVIITQIQVVMIHSKQNTMVNMMDV